MTLLPVIDPIDTALKDIWETVPDEVWDLFPADFAENMDHYLFGTPNFFDVIPSTKTL